MRAGTYVIEVSARYEFQPTVTHTQRITIEVEQLDQVQVVAAGTWPPGDPWRIQRVFHLGSEHRNALAQYSLDCISASSGR